MYPCIATAAPRTTTLPVRKASRRPTAPKCKCARSANSADGSAIRPSEYLRMRAHVKCEKMAQKRLRARARSQPACWKVYGMTRRVEPIIVFHSVKMMPTDPAFCPALGSASTPLIGASGKVGRRSRKLAGGSSGSRPALTILPLSIRR